MGVIGQFVAAYAREMDFYEAAARLARQHIESALRSNGIKAISTSRAKRPDSLETKLRKRAAGGRHYGETPTIRDDLADLAGVRVALYFPRERERVNHLIASMFVAVTPPKQMPDGSSKPFATADGEEYAKRFSGYIATHHRVQLREDHVSDDDRRLLSARIEIQVASVLMHAWSEVEHDLIYKPFSGKLSGEEHSILDEINGMVIAGEIALERLQAARDRRLQTQLGAFESQYELASYLFDHVRRGFDRRAGDEAMGRADWLFKLLQKADLNSRERIAPFLEALKPDFERRTIAEQVIDKIVAGDKHRYSIFQRIRESGAASKTEAHLALGRFTSHWAALEATFGKIIAATGGGQRGILFRRGMVSPHDIIELANRGLVESAIVAQYQIARQLRNTVAHGPTPAPPVTTLDDASIGVEEILQALAASDRPEVRGPAVQALTELGVAFHHPAP
jgi:ppGpp synthetase/RelA/SpoT-type nucleotidyltranferase